MKKLIIIAAALVLLQRCASVQAPQGGPKDSEPPLLLKSTPGNGEVNFREKFIQLDYSEPVSENDARQPFLSPITAVTVIPAGKKIRIIPDSGWKPNQTYELRLKKKIKDEREGNIAADTSLLFSTGPEPERIKLKINVQELSGKEATGKNTGLLTSNNNVRYFCSGESMLKLGGLREGKYHLEVFQDKNENLKYEEEDGKLFTDSLTIDSSTSIRVKPLPQMFKPLRYFHQRKGDTLQIESSRMIRPDSLLLKHCIGKNEDGTLFRIFQFRNKLILRNMDSLGTIFPDTIDRVETDSLRSLTEIPLKKKTRINRIGNKLEIAFTWNWKVLNHPKKIEYTKDSVWETVSSEKLDYGYLFQLPLLKAGKIKLRMDSLSFFNRRGMRKDSILINPADAEENGTIAGSIRSDEKNLVAELIDEEKQVVAKTGKGKFNWQVKPGRYKIQIFCDLNNDGIYTGGNIKQQRKAEPLFTYPGPVELKPGWDLENIEIKPDF